MISVEFELEFYVNELDILVYVYHIAAIEIIDPPCFISVVYL